MLDGPSDLIVIPCSTVPTISVSVAQRLRAVSIPLPTRRMELGEVVFLALEEASNLAPMAAYAASVRANSTTPEAIYSIGAALGTFVSTHPWAQQIASPLLGAGAGGLKSEVGIERLMAGFRATAPRESESLLRVYVLHREVYDRLKVQFAVPEMVGAASTPDQRRSERVFVSYTRTGDEHAQWVKDLATYLRNNGLNARLDVWHLRPGMDVAQWMCNELDLADRVLLICNATYADRADRRHGGVGWEIRLVQGDLMSSQEENSDKYVPIIVGDDANAATPAFLKSVYCLRWSLRGGETEEAHREELLRLLYNAAERAPEVGSPPSFVLAQTR